MKQNVRILFVGDVVGVPGRTIFQKHIDRIRQEYAADAVIVNGENSDARGRGLTSRIMNSFKHNGASVVTSGNHIWANKEIYTYLEQNTDLLRPANFPSECPGSGVTTFDIDGTTIGVINLQGRIFMRDDLACPFRTAESLLSYLKDKAQVIIVDMHAEATSEKMGMGYFLDGKVSAVLGTHTHVQTADERVLPGGTAYISDVGMAGSLNSMLGMKKEAIIKRFLTQMPTRFEVEESKPLFLSAVLLEVDTTTGKANSIERIRFIDDGVE